MSNGVNKKESDSKYEQPMLKKSILGSVIANSLAASTLSYLGSLPQNHPWSLVTPTIKSFNSTNFPLSRLIPHYLTYSAMGGSALAGGLMGMVYAGRDMYHNGPSVKSSLAMTGSTLFALEGAFILKPIVVLSSSRASFGRYSIYSASVGTAADAIKAASYMIGDPIKGTAYTLFAIGNMGEAVHGVGHTNPKEKLAYPLESIRPSLMQMSKGFLGRPSTVYGAMGLGGILATGSLLNSIRKDYYSE